MLLKIIRKCNLIFLGGHDGDNGKVLLVQFNSISERIRVSFSKVVSSIYRYCGMSMYSCTHSRDNSTDGRGPIFIAT